MGVVSGRDGCGLCEVESCLSVIRGGGINST